MISANYVVGKSNNNEIQGIQDKIKLKEKDLKKFALALEKVCGSYELGDYSRNEFLTRKSKWEEKINDTKSEIARYERELKPQE